MGRVLLITSVLPWPLHRNGGAQRTSLLRDALRRAGNEVDTLALLPEIDEPDPPANSLCQSGIIQLLHFPLDRPVPSSTPRWHPLASLYRLRDRWRGRYSAYPPAVDCVREQLASSKVDHVVVRYQHTALLCGLPASAGGVPVYVDLDDVDWLTFASRLKAQPWPGVRGRLGMQIALRAVRQSCLAALPAFAERFVASEEDAAEVRRLGVSARVLPNIPFSGDKEPEPLPPPAADAATVLFVGDLQFGPNHTGLDRFLAEGWPLVLRQVPHARLRIVGRGMTAEQEGRWRQWPGVEPVGFAEDLREEYRRCALTVAPTWWGGGTKIKVVESLAMGRPCVATRHAARGYGLLGKAQSPPLLIADNSAQLAQKTVDLLQDPERRRQVASAGPALVAQHFSFDTFATTIATTLSGPAGQPQAPEAEPAAGPPTSAGSHR